MFEKKRDRRTAERAAVWNVEEPRDDTDGLYAHSFIARNGKLVKGNFKSRRVKGMDIYLVATDNQIATHLLAPLPGLRRELRKR
jgi:hypothetical protein